METAQEALKKIPVALANISKIEFKDQAEFCKLFGNYAHNLVLTVLKDTQLRLRLHEEPEKVIEELSKL